MRSAEPRLPPAVFLDRDGTLIEEVDFLRDPAHVVLLPGTAPGLRAFRNAGYRLVIASNQSGIARGLFGEADYRAVHARLTELLAREGIRLDGAYHCPHHPDFTGPCDCRKPAAGLFRRAAAELGLDLARSIFIGDRLRDVAAARELGGTAILVETGYGALEAATAPPWVRRAADLAAAARLVLGVPAGVAEGGQ